MKKKITPLKSEFRIYVADSLEDSVYDSVSYSVFSPAWDSVLQPIIDSTNNSIFFSIWLDVK